jgi:hypothetical protein
MNERSGSSTRFPSMVIPPSGFGRSRTKTGMRAFAQAFIISAVVQTNV